MDILPTRLFTNEQIRIIERYAIEQIGIPEYTLMERAGSAALVVLLNYLPDPCRIVVVCGGGNNGGDGYVIARMAKSHGHDVSVSCTVTPNKLKGSALFAYLETAAAGVPIKEYAKEDFQKCDVIVDALLGTGLHGEISEAYQNIIKAINNSGRWIMSIDAPSGINVDTGHVSTCAVQANVTVTFIGLKQGLFTGQAPDYTGKVFGDYLQIPLIAYTQVTANCERLELASFHSYLKPRQRTEHKGHFGHVLIIGGDFGYAGAVRMAGEACARSGAGLVTIATRPEHLPIISNRPELMCSGIESAHELDVLIKKADVIAIGPGLGQSGWSKVMLDKVLKTDLPLVIDADGLNLLADKPMKREDWILTPHPGEAARLLATDAAAIQRDRFQAVRHLNKKYQGVVVLKGCGTLISAHNRLALCTYGNPGMASGGMGDVLTGIITGLVAQRIPLFDAASLGVLVHAHAADAAAEAGERGLLAMDLIDHIRRFINF